MVKFHLKNYLNWPVLASLIIIAQECLYLFWVIIKQLSGMKGQDVGEQWRDSFLYHNENLSVW